MSLISAGSISLDSTFKDACLTVETLYIYRNFFSYIPCQNVRTSVGEQVRRIRMFLGLPDPDPVVRDADSDPNPAPAQDPSLFS